MVFLSAPLKFGKIYVTKHNQLKSVKNKLNLVSKIFCRVPDSLDLVFFNYRTKVEGIVLFRVVIGRNKSFL